MCEKCGTTDYPEVHGPRSFALPERFDDDVYVGHFTSANPNYAKVRTDHSGEGTLYFDRWDEMAHRSQLVQYRIMSYEVKPPKLKDWRDGKERPRVVDLPPKEDGFYPAHLYLWLDPETKTGYWMNDRFSMPVLMF